MSNLKKTTSGFNYKYTQLADINDYLESRGISYYQFIDTNENGDDYIYTTPIIDGKELQARRGCKVIRASLSGKVNEAQIYGSGLTYARRYSLLMAFGLACEDDDGESLTEKKVLTIEDAKDLKIDFGKHNGKTLNEIFIEDSKYIEYLRENVKDNTIQQAVALIKPLPTLEEQKEMPKLMEELHKLLDETNTDHLKFYRYYGCTDGEMTPSQMKDAIKILKEKKCK